MFIFLKKIIISFIFDFLWNQLLIFLKDEVGKTDKKYDDALVDWFSEKKESFEAFIKAVW